MIAKGRPPGDGWKTALELAPDTGRNVRNTRPLLVRLVAAGELEQAEAANDRGQPCSYFRPVARA